MDELVESIRSRGFWHITIRPADYEEVRTDNILDLKKIVTECSVRIRGWDFPHVEGLAENAAIHDNHIEGRTSWQQYREVWRLHLSGQFVFLGGLWTDWTAESTMWDFDTTWPESPVLGVGDAFISLWEIYEFAARLSRSGIGSDSTVIRLRLGNMGGRLLRMDSPRRLGFMRQYAFASETWAYDDELSSSRLLANSRKRAMKPAMDLIRRFGWETSEETLESLAERVAQS